MAFRKKRTAKKAGRRRKRTSGKRRTSGVKKMIRREIARNIEDKRRNHFIEDLTLLGSAAPSTFDAAIIPLAPHSSFLDIQQGDGVANRQGNVITTKRLTFKGTMTPLPYTLTINDAPSPMQIKMWIFYDKLAPAAEPTPAVSGDFFDNNNSYTTFRNDLVDLWMPHNKERYRVFATRTFKLGHAMYQNAAGGNPNSQYSANNDFKMNCNFSMNLTKYMVKRVKFLNNDSDPITRGLYAMFQVVLANGLAMPSGETMAKLSCSLDYTYEDA